jgi:hypothetical protein
VRGLRAEREACVSSHEPSYEPHTLDNFTRRVNADWRNHVAYAQLRQEVEEEEKERKVWFDFA